jgi:hypothetical protein
MLSTRQRSLREERPRYDFVPCGPENVFSFVFFSHNFPVLISNHEGSKPAGGAGKNHAGIWSLVTNRPLDHASSRWRNTEPSAINDRASLRRIIFGSKENIPAHAPPQSPRQAVTVCVASFPLSIGRPTKLSPLALIFW